MTAVGWGQGHPHTRGSVPVPVDRCSEGVRAQHTHGDIVQGTPQNTAGLWGPQIPGCCPGGLLAAASLLVTPVGEVGDIGDNPEAVSGVSSGCWMHLGVPVGMWVPLCPPGGHVPGLPCYKYPLIKWERSARSNPLINLN